MEIQVNLDETAKILVQSSIEDILSDPKIFDEYKQDPEVVLAAKVKDIPKPQRQVAKAEIKKRVRDVEEILPGLNAAEAKGMLYASLRIPHVTFSIYTWLNVALFAVGILLFVLAAVAGFVREEEQFSIIFGAGGFASLLPLFITNPLKRISNAASDQSQLRTVIFGYWSQLANIRKQIIRSELPLDQKAVKELNTEFQHAMTHATDLLQRYVETSIKDTNLASENDIKALKERIEVLEKKLGE